MYQKHKLLMHALHRRFDAPDADAKEQDPVQKKISAVVATANVDAIVAAARKKDDEVVGTLPIDIADDAIPAAAVEQAEACRKTERELKKNCERVKKKIVAAAKEAEKAGPATRARVAKKRQVEVGLKRLGQLETKRRRVERFTSVKETHGVLKSQVFTRRGTLMEASIRQALEERTGDRVVAEQRFLKRSFAGPGFEIVGKIDGMMEQGGAVCEIKFRMRRFMRPKYDIDQLAAYCAMAGADGMLVQQLRPTKELDISEVYDKDDMRQRFETCILPELRAFASDIRTLYAYEKNEPEARKLFVELLA